MRPRMWEIIWMAIATVVRSSVIKLAKFSEPFHPFTFKPRSVKATVEVKRRPGIGRARSSEAERELEGECRFSCFFMVK